MKAIDHGVNHLRRCSSRKSFDAAIATRAKIASDGGGRTRFQKRNAAAPAMCSF